MKTRITKIIFIILVFVFVLVFYKTVSFAGEIIDTDDYQTTLQYGDATYIFNKGGQLIRVLRNIAAATSVVVLSIIGVKYMVGSVEQKAEYKQTMFPVLVGCFLVASLSIILTLIQSIAT